MIHSDLNLLEHDLFFSDRKCWESDPINYFQKQQNLKNLFYVQFFGTVG